MRRHLTQLPSALPPMFTTTDAVRGQIGPIQKQGLVLQAATTDSAVEGRDRTLPSAFPLPAARLWTALRAESHLWHIARATSSSFTLGRVL